jgi:hypothetical protein
MLLSDQSLDPEAVEGHGFEADVIEEGAKRWVVERITFAGGRALRPKE